MEETPVETQAPSSNDVMSKYANNISKGREQKQETLKTEPKPEIQSEPIAEAPKEPIANGQSKEPIKETQAPSIVNIPEETDWRKDLGFEDKVENNTPESAKDNSQELLKQYKSKAEEYDTISSDPLINAYKAAKEAGKDIFTFLNETRGKDINSMTPEQIWQASLESEEGLTPEEITTEMESFKELSKFEKIQKTKTFKQELINAQHENLKKYASDNKTQAIKKEELNTILNEQANQFFDKIKDKEWQGIKMTPSESNKLRNFLEKEFKFQNADGTYNYELLAKVGNYALNERTILQNIYKKGETKGYEKALLEQARPSNNDNRFNSAPEIKTTNKSEEAKKAAKAAFGS